MSALPNPWHDTWCSDELERCKRCTTPGDTELARAMQARDDLHFMPAWGGEQRWLTEVCKALTDVAQAATHDPPNLRDQLLRMEAVLACWRTTIEEYQPGEGGPF